ncbi:MAG: 50S ribosomal protein L5 [Verrucomicrobia bacterium]|nr:50S ribosomal protein L5 [Verrucomicrobiota bacterium]MCF7707827.1 50S ribosomal protein L5 [Verrucomicrobiota bacterium]
MKSRLYNQYNKEVRPSLIEKWKYENVHQVPRFEKIIVHMGVSSTLEKSAIDDAMKDMSVITGRKPVVDRAKRSVSNFKLRKGQIIGCHITLRRDVMFEFLDRLIAAALPRIRDFRGIPPKSFDGRGNYTMGVIDQTIFPEIDADKLKRHQGMDITIVTTAKSDAEAYDLLKLIGMPFADSK